jgi:hypothetical protein
MIELSANGKLFEEFAYINEINERIARGEAAFGQTRPIRLHLIKPRTPLPLDPDFYSGRIDAATLIDLGYADASRYLAEMHVTGLPLQPEATHMDDDTLTLAFHETMLGPFAMGETDPQKGAEAGKAAGTTMSISCLVNIHDLNRFIADPDHNGGISGDVSFAPLGENLPAKRGVFRLFAPTANPADRSMVYELAFAQGGQDYYLAGRKDVRHGPVFDLWRDTTTLYASLHQGTDQNGPVVGAGILTIDADRLAKLVESMHVDGAHSLGDKAQALLQFGRFFLGELWDVYGPAAHQSN